ncbi:hypothetical protein [Tomitella fengzijianii]|uniref:hypothetical protein n=1 Tax=Tomitella fengzijianii TaxID=2597660 RepID=UPI00131CB46E|nr:hypothetical protein [Tomitella fengzijianii]
MGVRAAGVRRSDAVKVGDRVLVRFGVRDIEATVVEVKRDRVMVRLQFEGADESIVTGYRAAEVRPVHDSRGNCASEA